MGVLWVKSQCDLWPRRDKDLCGNCLHPFVLDSSQTEQTGLASSTPRSRVGVERMNAEVLKSELFSRGNICGPLHPWNPWRGYLMWEKGLCNVMKLGTLRWYPALSRGVHSSYRGHYKWKREAGEMRRFYTTDFENGGRDGELGTTDSL